jgi:hypothetical protein
LHGDFGGLSDRAKTTRLIRPSWNFRPRLVGSRQ